MDLAAGAAGAVAGLLLHGKAKLVRTDKQGGGGGLGGALLNAAASAVGLGASDADDEMTFMFNPTEYRISQGVNFTIPDRRLLSDPTLTGEYLGTRAMTVSMQLFFDDFASAKGDVTPKITKLLKWQQPQNNEGKPPPLVQFKWGNAQLENFWGMITDLVISYTVFAKNGTPLQAKVDLTLLGADNLAPGSNPTSHAIDMRRVHTVVQGESIQSVAFEELGDPNYWRAIADVNDIDDPLRVRPGAALVIPSAADAARMA
ncbi:MAG TPA: hypothetical protein VGM49_03260 [Candidatus Limnocylindrales bacterium]|jgi:hypothetical protein